MKARDYIYLENMVSPQNRKLFSAYAITDDKFQKAFFFNQAPNTFIKYEIHLIDKKLIEEGYMTKAKVKWYGGGFAYPYLWKKNKADGDRESWGDPRVPKANKEEDKKQIVIPKLKKGKSRGII